MGAVYLLPSVGVMLVTHPELIDDRFRTFKAFYRAIETGMTTNEVFSVVDQYYPKSGRRRPKMMYQQPEDLFFHMDPEGSREPNCETIFLKLDRGRVKTKEYIPD